MSKPHAKPNTTETEVHQGKDLEVLLNLARNAFHSGWFSMAAEHCHEISEQVLPSWRDDLGIEAYYIWCLSNLKTGNYDEARGVCDLARRRFGDYLDLAYFETLISAVKGETQFVGQFAARFIELRDQGFCAPDSAKSRTWGRAEEVLLIWGQALEHLGDPRSAVDVYRRYLQLHPEDEAISNRMSCLAALSGP